MLHSQQKCSAKNIRFGLQFHFRTGVRAPAAGRQFLHWFWNLYRSSVVFELLMVLIDFSFRFLNSELLLLKEAEEIAAEKRAAFQ